MPPRKTPQDKPKIITDKNKKSLTETEVFDMFEFAKNASSMYGNIFTPDITNQRMQDINMNPLAATQDGINKALLNPKANEKALIGYSQYFELTDMIYKRLLLYVGNLLSFDLTYDCTNATFKDYSTPAYKKDLKTVQDFLNSFDYKQEFKKVVRQLVRQESFYSIFRTDGDKYIFQELPMDYCKITGKWDYSLLFDFNMLWFIQPSVDINMYPPVFKEYFNDIFKGGKVPSYTPSNPSEGRDGSYIYWHQTSPDNNFWMWKFSPEIITQTPLFSGLFADLVLKPQIRVLQTNVFILQAQKVMVGLIPLLNKDVKGASIKDSVAISSELLGKFLGLLKQGLSECIKVGGVPFSDIKTLDFDAGDKNMYEEYNKNTVAMSGVNSKNVFSIDKANAVDSQLSANVDEYMVTYLYPFFNDFLNYHVKKLTKNFSFNFQFEGTEFYTNRKERMETQLKIMPFGIILPQKIAAAMGMSYSSFQHQLDMARADKFTDNLTIIIQSSQMSGKDSPDNGRPKSDNPKDSTITTQGAASNIEKGGNI